MMGNIFLDAMQHEKGWSQRQAWIDHWGKLKQEIVKTEYLMMLKERRDRQRDVVAGEVFKILATAWIDERFLL